MAYGRFDVAPELIKLTPEQVCEYSSAAAKHYTTDLAYHNWNHAMAVASGNEIIADKLGAKGQTIARGALVVVGFWHDAGFHQDHVAKGFTTKEEYSAALLEAYLSDKPVSDWERSMMLRAITATYARYPDARDPYQLITHRSDTANIGGPTDEFIENSLNLWKEAAYLAGKKIPWQKYVDGAARFIEFTYTEHDAESLENFIDPQDTTVDVHDMPFREQALKNIEALKEVDAK